jgi:hypothetical protein
LRDIAKAKRVRMMMLRDDDDDDREVERQMKRDDR